VALIDAANIRSVVSMVVRGSIMALSRRRPHRFTTYVASFFLDSCGE
jgi:hypothetical protein